MSEIEGKFNKLLDDLITNYGIHTKEELEKAMEKKRCCIEIFTEKVTNY